jgi:cysteine desulfurase
MGLDPEWTKGGLRLTVGIQNTQADIDYFLGKMPDIIQKLQKLQAVG